MPVFLVPDEEAVAPAPEDPAVPEPAPVLLPVALEVAVEEDEEVVLDFVPFILVIFENYYYLLLD